MEEKEKISRILSTAKRIAVVGLSPKSHRTSHYVSEYLQKKGYKILPVYPREEKILGEKVYRSVSEIEGGADTVLVFRKSEEVLCVVEDAVKVKPNAVWMQEGVVNEAAAELAEKNGAIVVMDKCMYKEHVKSGL